MKGKIVQKREYIETGKTFLIIELTDEDGLYEATQYGYGVDISIDYPQWAD